MNKLNSRNKKDDGILYFLFVIWAEIIASSTRIIVHSELGLYKSFYINLNQFFYGCLL